MSSAKICISRELTPMTVVGPMVDLSLVKYHVEKLSAIMSCPTAMMNSDVCRERSIHIMIK
jgi:hypothetical protein